MKDSFDKISAPIENPEIVKTISVGEWNILISQSRFHDLIPFIYQIINDHGLYDEVPDPIKDLLTGYKVRLAYQQTLFLWESSKLNELIINTEYPVILLKGMAYLEGKLGTYQSRGFADIDLLVPEIHFKNFETLLLKNGWEFRELNDYDDHYYREWSHASPPMKQKQSGVELDLHHHISSPLSDIKIDNKLLFNNIQLIHQSNFYRLSDLDVILHCANHFIYFDDVNGKLKDLLLIYYLLIQFESSDIWTQLYQRSLELGLTKTLYYMTRLLECYFKIEPPITIKNKINYSAKGVLKHLVFDLLKYCIAPKNPDGLLIKIMSVLLLIRYQWTRYPLKILLVHLIKKHLIVRIKNLLT